MLLDLGAEVFTNIDKSLLLTTLSHHAIREVSMHSRSIPVTFNRLWMPLNTDLVFLTNPLQEISSNPELISSVRSTFSENLELPLSFHDFSVDSFNSESSIDTGIEVFFDDLSSDSFTSTD